LSDLPTFNFEANHKQSSAGMISPESGIHRPSYNGAPAKQTMNDLYVAECVSVHDPCASTCAARRHIARTRVH